MALGLAAVMTVTLVTPVAASDLTPAQLAWEIPDAIESPPVELKPIVLPEGDFTNLGTPGPDEVAQIGEEQPHAALSVPEFDEADLEDQEVIARDEFTTTYDLGDGYRVSEVVAAARMTKRGATATARGTPTLSTPVPARVSRR